MPPAAKTDDAAEKIRALPADAYTAGVAALAAGRLRWHFSPQYFTSAQLARHFLRYSKGRPHVAQILVGRCPLRSFWGSIREQL